MPKTRHYPLNKRLTHNRPKIVHAELLPQQLTIAVHSGRSDPINHAIGKRHVLFDPLQQTSVHLANKAAQHFLEDPSIPLDVVTRLNGAAAEAPLSPHPQRLAQIAEQRLGTLGMRQLLPDRRILKVELAARHIVVVAPLRDCQCDHLFCWIMWSKHTSKM